MFFIMGLDYMIKRPEDMTAYLVNNGWHFSRKMCDYAVSKMKKKDESRLQPTSKDDVDNLLSRYGIEIKNKDKGLYDYVYVYNMLRADMYKSSITDEQHLAMGVKDIVDDIDAPEDAIFRKWYVCQIAKGEPIDWAEKL